MELLLSPISIGNCPLPNRFVMTAASLCRSPDGVVSEELIDFYAARARGGVGLLIGGGADVDPVYRSNVSMMRIDDDRFLAPLQRLTDRVHQEGGKLFLQLLHEGPYAPPTGEGLPLSPSGLPSRMIRSATVVMTQREIDHVVSCFAEGAYRARAAGFDGVEICASVGYLFAQFLSPATNHRTDQYGGSIQNRMRFLLETVAAVKKAAGADFPLMVRLSGQDFIPGGSTIDDTVEIAKALEQSGVHGLSITGGWHETRVPQITGHVPHGGYLALSRAVKEQVAIPVVSCNRMNVTTGRQALEDGSCDLIGMCRPFLADPFLVRKVEQQQEDTITACLSCNQRCLDHVFAGKPVGCVVNPKIGRELHPVKKSPKRKRILVVGGGISGLQYGAEAGAFHDVTIAEATGHIGGVGKLLAKLPSWADSHDYVQSLYHDCLRKNVAFQFYRKATVPSLEEDLQQGRYDEIVIAAGGCSPPPPFPVTKGSQVFLLSDFVENPRFPGGDIAVIGNDFRGFAFALGCAKAHRHREERTFFSQWTPTAIDALLRHLPSSKVTCIGPQKKMGIGTAKSVVWASLQEAEALGLQSICEATVTAVTDEGVFYEKDGTQWLLPAQTVILAQGWQSNPSLRPDCFAPSYRERMVWIGDAKRPGRIWDAVSSAVSAAESFKE